MSHDSNVEIVRRAMQAFDQNPPDVLPFLGSDVEGSVDAFNVYTVRDGKVIRMEFFTSAEPALEAAGLTPTRQKERA